MSTTVTKRGQKGTCVFLFDYTGIMCQPWLKAGYTCYIVDGQHPDGVHQDTKEPLLYRWGKWINTSNHTSCMVDVMKEIPKCDFLFGFPECTDLAVTGACWFPRKRRKDPEFQTKAMACVYYIRNLGESWDCPWALENPVSVISTLWRPPDVYFHPWEYGGYLNFGEAKHPTYPEYIKPFDAYPKKTGVWWGNGFIMPEKKPVLVVPGYSQQHLKLGGKSLKTKNIRSATPRGFAKAVYESNKG